MAALVDFDLNCRPPSPEPAATEEAPRAMLRQEQHFPHQMKELHKFYGSLWKQSSGAPYNLHSSHEHKLKKLGLTGNQNPEISIQNLDVRSHYHGVIDLEMPTTSGDAVETVGCSGSGNLPNRNGRSQDGSCCVSPDNNLLAESARLGRGWNSSRISAGSVGSSETPNCQSPIKPSNIESRHSLIDLNVSQDESLLVFNAPSQETYSLSNPCSTYPRDSLKSSREVSQKECASAIGSLKGSSITVIVPRSAADSSRNVVAASSVQQKDLFDLNVSLENIDMPSEIISASRDKVVINDGSKRTASSHSLWKKNIMQAETSRKHLVVQNDHVLASKDDNNMLLRASPNNGIDKVQPPESGANNKELLISETPLVDNHVRPRLGASHNGPSKSQVTVGMLQAEAEGDDKAAATAAETLLFISHNSAYTADCPRSNSQTSVQEGNDEPQCSLDSFEKIVLNLEEIRDDGQSIPVLPPDNDGPSCRIKLKRGRGMRNFQREIIPGLISLARQEICDDLDAIGYEPKKTRSRKTRRGQGAPSTRSRPRKRGSAGRN